MIYTHQAQHLVQPLLSRAYPRGREKGHPDYAAQQILTRLGISGISSLKAACNQKNTLGSAWVDAQVEKFLALRPYTKGVEIDYGISTRFHRLSHQADWPRFSWLIMSNVEVDNYLTYILPKLDNFKHILGLMPLSNLEEKIDLNAEKALFILVGEQYALNKKNTYLLLKYLFSSQFQHLKGLELVLFHQHDDSLSQQLNNSNKFKILSQWRPYYSQWQSFLNTLSNWCRFQKQCVISHIQFINNAKEVQ